jgi:hypothetical protein
MDSSINVLLEFMYFSLSHDMASLTTPHSSQRFSASEEPV